MTSAPVVSKYLEDIVAVEWDRGCGREAKGGVEPP